jgi:hypothetical protein
MLATATRDHTMTTSFANTLTLSSIEAGAAKIVIDPFLSDNPSPGQGVDRQPCRRGLDTGRRG